MAIESVLSGSDEVYSPIVLYGPSGTGKSHLALGLAGAWKARFRERPAVYVTATDFARELADAIQTKTMDDFRVRYRRVALLAFDDVHHLEEKPAAQRELMLTLETLADAGSHILVTLARLPAELPGIMPGLRARLAAGLAVPVAPPGPEARLVILCRLASMLGINLSDPAARLLAEGICGTAPELSAALTELHLSAGPGAMIDAETARRYLADRDRPPGPSLQRIAVTTARCFSLPLADLKGSSRQRAITTARGVAVYLARSLTAESLQEIGRYFGGRDHTTVSYSIRRTEERLQTEPELKQTVLALHESLKSE